MNCFAQGHALLIGVGGDLPGTVREGRRLVCLLTNDEFVFSPAAEMLEYDFRMSKTRWRMKSLYNIVVQNYRPRVRTCAIVVSGLPPTGGWANSLCANSEMKSSPISGWIRHSARKAVLT